MGGPASQVTFLKKGIRFSRVKVDMTWFGLALGERCWGGGGGSGSSDSKPTTSMSMATHRYRHIHTVTYGTQQSKYKESEYVDLLKNNVCIHFHNENTKAF